MRALLLALLAVTLSACGSSTEPGTAGDPSLLFTNNLSSPVYLTWQDGQGIVGRDTIPALTANHCSRFVAQPDSAYFQITASDNGAESTYTAPWFNPSDRPAWTVSVSSAGQTGSPLMLVQLSDTPC